MSSTQPITSNSQLFSSGNATEKTVKSTADSAQDRFMKLLVTQMKNQNPLKPLDNAEVTSQLAQITTVTGIEKLNSTLKLLVSDIESSRTVEAASLIGRDVLVPGKSLMLENNIALGGVDLPQAVDKLSITISDSTGAVVHTIDRTAQPTGVSTFTWDGMTDNGAKAANGNYSFSVSAKQGDKDITVNPLALESVKSVSHGEHDAILDMGKSGLINYADVKKIF